MRRNQKADRIHEILVDLYPKPPIPLDHKSDYELLVAVLLSAQCTDKRVNTVTPKLFAKANSPQKMSKVPVAEIQSIIRPCGLSPAKAKNISALSHLLMERHDSIVPDDLDALEDLPGVGHKTASVVMAQAFGVPSFPVDTHIHRLASRWGLSAAKNVVQTERDLKSLFPKASWNDLHLQIIYFGREYCPARGHDLSQCPICGWAATKKRIREDSPARKK